MKWYIILDTAANQVFICREDKITEVDQIISTPFDSESAADAFMRREHKFICNIVQ